MDKNVFQEMISEMESKKEYIADTKNGKRKEAKKNAAINECIEVVQRFMCSDYE